MTKYLLTGGSGTLGTELIKNNPGLYFAPSSSCLDIITPNNKLPPGNFAGIIHCAAYTDVPGAETEIGRTKATELNIIGTYNMANVAKSLGIPFIYISTDYVYDGEGVLGGYTEADIPKPFNYYGTTKFVAESFANGPEDLIIRTSFKPSGPWKYTHAFTDLFTSADYVDVIGPMINKLILSKSNGIYNVGTECKTIYELAVSRNPQICRMSKNTIGTSLPDDVSMDTRKYEDLKL